MKNINLIMESAHITDIQIIEESIIPGQLNKLKFKAVLQEANHVNNNKRFYGEEALMEVVRQLQPKARARKLMGEMDHPQPQGDNAAKVKRSSTILMQNVCVLFTDIQFIGGQIVATCETLTNRMGMDFYALLKDGVVIGFSLRAFGQTKPRPDGTIEVVAQGLKALTFDAVVNPSHDNAIIIEFLNESTDIMALINEMNDYKSDIENIEESSLIEESCSLISSINPEATQNDKQAFCINGLCMRAPLEESIDYLMGMAIDSSVKKISISI